MGLNLLPLDTLGAIETSGVVSFGIWLPWVSAAEQLTVVVPSAKVLPEAGAQVTTSVPSTASVAVGRV